MSATNAEVKPPETSMVPEMFMNGNLTIPWVQRIEQHPSWPVLARVPEMMTALVPLPHFTVRDLLTMEHGRVFSSASLTSDLIPMKIGTVQIAWGEFEVVEHVLAVRVTKLA